MIINFDVTGPRRKQLVTAIAGFTNRKAEYHTHQPMLIKLAHTLSLKMVSWYIKMKMFNLY